MLPVKTKAATGIYGAPRGHEAEVGGLPYWRDHDVMGGRTYTVVRSAWRPSADELAQLNAGGVIVLGIHGMEPIPPIDLAVAIDDPQGVRDPRAEIA